MASNDPYTPLGEVKVTLSEVEWRIPNFDSLSEEYYYSPTVSFAGASWDFIIYPNGVSGRSDGYVTVFLTRYPPVPPIALKVSFAIKTLEGMKDREKNDTEHFIRNEHEIYASYHCISRDELLKRSSELLPSDVLTVHCPMEHLQTAEDANGAATSLCCYCKNTLDGESVPFHEKICTERPIKCPKCSEVVLLQDWHLHECQTARTEEEEELIRDFKKMLSDG